MHPVSTSASPENLGVTASTITPERVRRVTVVAVVQGHSVGGLGDDVALPGAGGPDLGALLDANLVTLLERERGNVVNVGPGLVTLDELAPIPASRSESVIELSYFRSRASRRWAS